MPNKNCVPSKLPIVDRPTDSQPMLRKINILHHLMYSFCNILNLKELSKSIYSFKSYRQKQVAILPESGDKLEPD